MPFQKGNTPWNKGKTGFRHSPESNEKNRQAHLGKKASKETREKMSEALTGEKHPFYGKKLSEEHKQKIKENHAHISGKNHSAWKGGIKYDTRGYKYIYQPNHPYCDKNKYIREHRLIAEKYLGRYLLSTEVIHHINGVKDDNKPENLYLFFSNNKHSSYEGLEEKPELISNLPPIS